MGRQKTATKALDKAQLKLRRRALGLTQEQLAELASLTTRTVQNAEAGQAVSLHTAQHISKALGVPMSALLRPAPAQIAQALRLHGLWPTPPPRWTVGREAPLARGLTLLRADAPVALCIGGLSGLGKTTLAQVLAQTLAEDFPEGVAWVTDRGTDLKLPGASQWMLLARALGFEARLPPLGAVSPAAWRQAYAAALWQRPRLLIIDDVVDCAEFAWLLAPSMPWRALVTTAQRTAAEDMAALGAVALELTPMSPRSAWALLAQHVPAARLEADAQGTARLIKALAGVPRSLHVAGRALSRERFVTPTDYADGLAAMTPGHAAARIDAAADIQTFKGAFDQLQARLDDRTLAAFAALGVFGRAPIPLDWASAALGENGVTVRRTLSALADAFLLRELHDHAPPRFWLDAQAWRASCALGDAQTRQRTWARLIAHAQDQAEALRRQPVIAKALQALTRDFALWKRLLDHLAGQLIPRDEAMAAMTPEALPASEPTQAPGALLKLTAALSQLLPHVAPTDSQWWFKAAVAEARDTAPDALPAALEHTGAALMHTFNFPLARGWLLQAAHTSATHAQWRRAVRTTSDAARMAFTQGDVATSLAEQRRLAPLLAHLPDVTSVERAWASAVVGATTLFHPGPEAPHRAQALEHLRRAVSHLNAPPALTTQSPPQATARVTAQAACAAAIRLSLAALEGVEGGPQTLTAEALQRALAVLMALDTIDALDTLRFELLSSAWHAASAAPPQREPSALELEARLEALILTGAPHLTSRRLTFFSELLSYAVAGAATRGALQAPPSLSGLAVRDLGLTDLLLAAPGLPSSLPNIPLLYPLEPLQGALLAPGPLSVVETFVALHTPDGHPLRALVAMLKAQ